MPQEIAQSLVFISAVLLKADCGAVCVCVCSCTHVYIYLCVRILQVLSFEGVTPGCAHKRTVFNVRL